MKIAWFKKNISPEIGAKIAGYDFHSVSVMKLDDIFMDGLCMDDGEKKALLISFDLQCLDGSFVQNIRRKCAGILGIPEEAVFLTCTHNHTGPEASTPWEHPEAANTAYIEKLEKAILESVQDLSDADFRECEVGYYSSCCDENRNRRYTTADNCASFTAHRREVVPIAAGFADKELGQLNFWDSETRQPLYLIGNYAAHPLAGHSPGLGGLRISADFPGAFRNYITRETGAEAMFISGAAGDMVPREDELGSDAATQMGIRLAKAAIGGLIDSRRNRQRFVMNDPKLGYSIGTFSTSVRNRYIQDMPPEYEGKKEQTLEIQLLSIGDICFVGVPGELCAELGQEIKWHTPFRRAFIAYYSTADFGYICPANFLVAGGYEGNAQRMNSMGGFSLVQCAVESMFALRKKLHPDQILNGEPYPDYLKHPLVHIPEN